jgi:hypothetical protein
VVPLHTLASKVLSDERQCKIAAVVSAEHPQVPPALVLHNHLDLLEGLWRAALLCKEGCSPVPCGIIYQQQDVALTSWSHRCDGAAQVTVYEIERLVHPILGLLGEGGALVLAGDADVAQLLNVSQLR